MTTSTAPSLFPCFLNVAMLQSLALSKIVEPLEISNQTLGKVFTKAKSQRRNKTRFSTATHKLRKKRNSLILLFGLMSGQSYAGLIAHDLAGASVTSPTNLVSFTNDALGVFESGQDGFQTYLFDGGPLNFIPDGLIDRSGVGYLDNYGLIMPKAGFSFFGVTDTVNASNLAGDATAVWSFDVTGSTDISVAMDFAAMGDFESSDSYNLSYAFDGNSYQSLFEIDVETALSQNYTMENGNVRILNDPLSVQTIGSPFSYSLNNQFQTFESTLSGSGDLLHIQLSVVADGGTEAFGLSNIQISGQDANVISDPTISVPEPNTLAIMALTMVGLFRRFYSV